MSGEATEHSYSESAVERLLSYIPASLVARASSGARVPQEPWREDFLGAVGFVDVSGFTALSERLKSEFKNKGAELLNQYMNSYFRQLILVVAASGGDVVKFAGDALQVVWRDAVASSAADEREAGLARLVLRAARCCMSLLNELNEFSPVEGVLLTLHVGIGAGSLSGFCVGGVEGKWEYFIAGEPIEQMAEATDLAASGQLVLSKRAGSLLRLDAALAPNDILKGGSLVGEGCLMLAARTKRTVAEVGKAADAAGSEPERALVPRLARLVDSTSSRSAPPSRPASAIAAPASTARGHLVAGAGLHLGKLSGPEIDALRCFVPSLIEERLASGQAGLLFSEHRAVTSVFLKLIGLGAKPCEPADLGTTHTAVRVVQEAVKRHGGSVLRLLTDDKGTRFLIAFGLLGQQHEDPVSRAVSAALEAAAHLCSVPTPVPAPAVSPHGDATADGLAQNASEAAESPVVLTHVRCAIGVTTGKVFCGEAGCDVRREYTLMGSAVNMAARLMQAAEKQGRSVLVDEETYNAVPENSRIFERLDPILVKGRADPLPIFEPMAHAGKQSIELASLLDTRRGDQSAAPPAEEASLLSAAATPATKRRAGAVGRIGVGGTVGRHVERRSIQDALQLLERGVGGALVLLGEAGLGKTQLVQVLHQEHGSSVGMLRLVGTEEREANDFSSWRPVFRRLLSDATLQHMAHRSKTLHPPLTPAPQRASHPQRKPQHTPLPGPALSPYLPASAPPLPPSSPPASAPSVADESTSPVQPSRSSWRRTASSSKPRVAMLSSRFAVDAVLSMHSGGTFQMQSPNAPKPGQPRTALPHLPMRDAGEQGRETPLVRPNTSGLHQDGKQAAEHGQSVSPARARWHRAYANLLAWRLHLRIVASRGLSVRPEVDATLFSDPHITSLAPLLTPVLPNPLPPNGTTRKLAGAQRKEATLSVMVRVLSHKLKGVPAVVVVEDADHMGPLSWALLRALMEALPSVLVVVTLQPLTPRPAEAAALLNSPRCKTLRLEGLAEANISALAARAVRASGMEPRLASLIHRRCDGNPLYAMELSLSLIHAGHARLSATGLCELAVEEQCIELPSGVEGLITSRIDRLPANQQLWLKVASVLGPREVTLAALLDLARSIPSLANNHNASPAAIKKALIGLTAVDMLRPTPGSTRGDFRNTHECIHEAAYNLLPAELKEALHRAAGEYFDRHARQAEEANLQQRQWASLSHRVCSKRAMTRRLPHLLVDLGAAAMGEVRSEAPEAQSQAPDQSPRSLRVLGAFELSARARHHWVRAAEEGNEERTVCEAVRHLTKAVDAELMAQSVLLPGQPIGAAAPAIDSAPISADAGRGHETSNALELSKTTVKILLANRELAGLVGPARRRLGQSYLQLGRVKEARAELQRAVYALGGGKVTDLGAARLTYELAVEWCCRYSDSLVRTTPPRSDGTPKRVADVQRLELSTCLLLLAHAERHSNVRAAQLYALRARWHAVRLPSRQPALPHSHVLLAEIARFRGRASSAKKLARWD